MIKPLNMRRLTAWTIAFASLALAGQSLMAQEGRQHWIDEGAAHVKAMKSRKTAKHPAKNLIFFVGDGMGMTTVTAARILQGQMMGKPGEEHNLSWDEFEYVGLQKTYETNQQTPDSAGTMTAMITGVKTKSGVISLDEDTMRADHTTARRDTVMTLVELAEHAGLSTGIVTTTRLTHATPAACYSHSPDRDWEADSYLSDAAKAAGFQDIAAQLMSFPYGNGIEVAMGGGRRNFIPKEIKDIEGKAGKRNDGRDMTKEWAARGGEWVYVEDQSGFNSIDVSMTNHVLGLFESSHMQYEYDRPMIDKAGEPSLAEMVGKSLDILAKNPAGYLLVVEAGRIDHAHHGNNAYRALTDTLAMDAAVRLAVQETNPNETTIIVTADHGHVMTLGGYAVRGNPILGKVTTTDSTGLPKTDFEKAGDELPFTVLTYANGPGFPGFWAPGDYAEFSPVRAPNFRGDIPDDASDPSVVQEAAVPMASETHSGEDIAIYATGPNGYLVEGVMEQSTLFHVMREVLGL